jgi:hypothetical protein
VTIRIAFVLLIIAAAWLAPQHSSLPAADADKSVLRVGFAEVDITPELKKNRPVYMAGFSHNRKATSIHDPLKARAVVLQDGTSKIALVSVDVIGLFHATALRIRAALPGFTYVLVSSTHNHEGPDTLGLWGPTWFASGVDADYRKRVEDGIVSAVRDADKNARPVTARIGFATAPELLHDNREPYVKHDELVALQFQDADGKNAGVVVQWNCHPETLDSENTAISADFVGYTVQELHEKYRCPVVYLTGTVGGLMTSLKVPIQDEQGKPLADGTFAKTERYGRLVGKLATKALAKAKPLRLTPLRVRSREVYLPLENKLYQLGRQMGVLERDAFVWTGDPYQAKPAGPKDGSKDLALRTEVAWLRLGELDVACVPGEIYPELVLDKVQDPADPGADFPDAPIEPALYKQTAGPYRMLIGLANDEIGYIIPKRQWDEKPPYCYGRKEAQYGEANSVGPETAPLLCRAFQELVRGAK